MSELPSGIWRQAELLCVAGSLRQLPPDRGREIAFAGRSNAGKSSAINALTGRRALARTSRTPGRTRALIFFALGDAERRLVDLPGYGFARVPAEVQRAWAGLVEGYLAARRSLAGVVLVMDARHPFKALDEQLLEWCARARVPVQVLLTKADKLARRERRATLEAARERLAAAPWGRVGVALFSATRREGLAALSGCLEGWLDPSCGQKEAPACCSGGGRDTSRGQ